MFMQICVQLCIAGCITSFPDHSKQGWCGSPFCVLLLLVDR